MLAGPSTFLEGCGVLFIDEVEHHTKRADGCCRNAGRRVLITTLLHSALSLSTPILTGKILKELENLSIAQSRSTVLRMPKVRDGIMLPYGL